MQLKCLFLAVWAVLGSFKAHASELIKTEKYWENMDAMVNRALELFNVPGIAVGVVVDNKIVLTRGYGLRDAGRGLPVTENTVFPIASCTKGFTSFVLGQLVEEGKIEWDDPVIKYIPEFRLADPELTANVTIRDLIAHRTGYPRGDVLWHTILNLSRADVLELLSKLTPSHGLREKFEYNNFMYIVAGTVIERVTKTTVEEAVFTRILKPLGMVSSTMSIEELQAGSEFSLPYAEVDGVIEEVPFRDLHLLAAASAINSNVRDMAKWVQLQLSSDKKEIVQEMHSLQMPIASPVSEDQKPSQLGYGLGWFVGDFRGHNWINHGGIMDGVFSEISLLPEKKIGLVILTNSSTDGVYAISYIRNSFFDQLLGTQGTDWSQEIQEGRSQAKLSLKQGGGQVASSSAALKKYVGRFVHPAYGTMQVSIENNRLAAGLGRMRVPLNFKGDNTFEAKFPSLLVYGINPFIEFLFIDNSSGAIDELQVPFEHFRAAKPVVFRRI